MSVEARKSSVYDSLCEELAIAGFNTVFDELNDEDKGLVHEVACGDMLDIINERVADFRELVKPGKELL